MRRVQLFIILFLGGLGVFLEFRNIRDWSLFGGDLFDNIPLFALCILTVIYLFKNTRQYRHVKRLVYFFPSVTGLLFLVLIFGHKLKRSSNDNSPTLFTATNYDIGSDGGFTLDFKKNNYLKGKKVDRFSTTYYWGTYQRLGDTIMLNIPLDFEMGRRAILQDRIMRFIDDTVRFNVFKQQ